LAADSDFRDALSLDPTLIQAQRARIEALGELGRSEEMMEVAAAVAKRGDSDLEGLLTRGRAFLRSGFPDVAASLFAKALDVDPGNQEAAWYLTVARGWSDDALGCLEAGKAYVRRFGEDPEIYLWMAVLAGTIENSAEADAYMNRSLQLFGDDNSNLYSVAFAIAAQLSRNAPSARPLIEHWLPLLRARLQASPDNARVLAALIAVEGFAGELAPMRTHLDQYCRGLDASPTLFNSFHLMLGVAAIAHSGDVEALEMTIHSMRHADLANLESLFQKFFVMGQCTPRARSVLANSPAYQEFLSDIRHRVDELGSRYIPVAGLHHAHG
jgi:tetratricopeptide (TPR) repeat protein